jgi:hypothetical protein
MIPKPRNPDPVEPVWCARTAHGGRLLSKEVRVGVRHNGGEAAAWLEKNGAGPVRVGLVVAYLTGIAIDIDLDDAAALRDGLTDLLEQAGYEAPARTRLP